MNFRGALMIGIVSLWANIAGSADAPPKLEYATENNIAYYTDARDEYQKERCKLDVYYPKGARGFPTVVCSMAAASRRATVTFPVCSNSVASLWSQ
jgi:hypothetical protein